MLAIYFFRTLFMVRRFWPCWIFCSCFNLLIRVFGAQILDFNGQICLKFECNGIKKSWTEIRTTPFYLRQYGMLRIVLSTILCKAPKIGIS